MSNSLTCLTNFLRLNLKEVVLVVMKGKVKNAF